jgi:hypothetical protein
VGRLRVRNLESARDAAREVEVSQGEQHLVRRAALPSVDWEDLRSTQGDAHGRLPWWERQGYGPAAIWAVATSARSRWPDPPLALPMSLHGLHAIAAMAPVMWSVAAMQPRGTGPADR